MVTAVTLRLGLLHSEFASTQQNACCVALTLIPNNSQDFPKNRGMGRGKSRWSRGLGLSVPPTTAAVCTIFRTRYCTTEYNTRYNNNTNIILVHVRDNFWVRKYLWWKYENISQLQQYCIYTQKWSTIILLCMTMWYPWVNSVLLLVVFETKYNSS